MMGAEQVPEETEEEREAREARLDTPEVTFGDIFHPEVMARRQRALAARRDAILERYGLNPAHAEGEEQYREDMHSILSEDQKQQLSRAERAYMKRDYPVQARGDFKRSLLTFAATNPPEVLRKHIWRLQRGMDKPMYGTVLEKPLVRIRNYQAALMIRLCDNCADDLCEDTKDSGAEEWGRDNSTGRLGYQGRQPFYSHGGSMGDGYGGIYLFKYGVMYVERDSPGSLFGDDQFPYTEPTVCSRCGVDEVELWRERYGEE
jgi:hypothetical protein